MEKYGTAGLATQHNTAHALFMLDNQVYTLSLSLSLSHTHTDTHTHKIQNTYCFA